MLLDAAALPGGGYVLATSAGPLQLPALPAHEEGGMREMFADESVLARPLTDDKMGTPPALRGAPPTRRLAAPDGTVWLASRRGVWPLRRLRAAD